MNRPEENLEQFERQLAMAMKRVAAPETMVKSVMLAAEAEERRTSPGRRPMARILMFSKPVFRIGIGSAIAAALVVGILAGEQAHERHQQARAEQQFEAAMRVTDHALDQTRAQLERAGLKLGD